MNTAPTLKEQQLAWAVAWQDHGDRAALARLCESVERFVGQQAAKYSRSPDMFEELRAEFRLAVVEAAGKFDRTRPDGFLALCGFYMQSRARRVRRQASSPAYVPDRAWSPAARVVVSNNDDELDAVQLAAPEPYQEGTVSVGALARIIDEAGLNAREWRVAQRYSRNETLEYVGSLWGFTGEYARQIEAGALKKLRRVLRAKGLSLEDLL